MKDVQGYVVITPNDPTGRGMLYFNIEKAREMQKTLDDFVTNYWGIEGHFDTEFWKEKPLQYKIYSLKVREEV